MPIERIDPPGATPGTPLPNRSPAVADTDPSGRPVATAAQVAALTSGRRRIIVAEFAGGA